ncbi:Tetratricopeptide repeat [Methylophilaceae bacterium]
MHLGNAPSKLFTAVWLLGFSLLGYLAWHAHQHMQKSIASRILLAQAQLSIPAPVKPILPLTDAFLASALADEPSPTNTQKARDDESSVKTMATLDAPASTVDNPVAKLEQAERIGPASQTKQTGKRKTTVKTSTKLPSLHLTVQHSSALLQANLMQAYQAYVDGDAASAESHYRQVLEIDRNNVEAMLGMAAIAQRQGHQDEAAAWYQSVLAVAPNNTLALLATLPMQDKAYAESRIKGLLQDQPKAAYLHAALANFYAEQGLWSAAEAAYFDASQLAPHHAEYAFNLAVSLEHMGQPLLAFQQYARALELLKPSASDSLSKKLIEMRMQALK